MIRLLNRRVDTIRYESSVSAWSADCYLLFTSYRLEDSYGGGRVSRSVVVVLPHSGIYHSRKPLNRKLIWRDTDFLFYYNYFTILEIIFHSRQNQHFACVHLKTTRIAFYLFGTENAWTTSVQRILSVKNRYSVIMLLHVLFEERFQRCLLFLFNMVT